VPPDSGEMGEIPYVAIEKLTKQHQKYCMRAERKYMPNPTKITFAGYFCNKTAYF
jgi:hypothetical protein